MDIWILIQFTRYRFITAFEKSKCSFKWFEEEATYDVGKETRRREMKTKEVDAIATALAEALNEKAEDGRTNGRKPFNKAAIKVKR